MKKKITTYEEVQISEELKAKCQKYLKDNPITIYWNYNNKLSLEQVEKIMTSEETYNELENEIFDNCLEYSFQLEDELINNMKEEFEELKDFENADIREEFLDFIAIDYNIEQLLRNTPDVRIRVVIHSNYEGVNWADRGEGNFKESEYIQQIKKLLKGKYEEKSFQQELDNICSCVNQLIFYFKADVEELKGIKERFKKSIIIPKSAWCGFFDSFQGSGSTLEIKLIDDVKIKKQYGKTEYDNIEIVLDQNNKYSVEEVYGLCGVPEVSIEVK